jgi:cobalt-precorrin 5A hydrolase
MNSETQKRSAVFKGLILSLTPGGDLLGKRLLESQSQNSPFENWQHFDAAKMKQLGGTYSVAAAQFAQVEAIVFIGATGIAVRAIAPHLKGKFVDPAVLVIDERGRFVISLLSGHAGGANMLATNLAEAIGAVAVITTATDVNEKASLDLILKSLACPLEPNRNLCVEANQQLVSDKEIDLYVDPSYLTKEAVEARLTGLVQSGANFCAGDLEGDSEEGSSNWNHFLTQNKNILKIYIGYSASKIDQVLALENGHAVIPKAFALGTGSRRGVETAVYQENLNEFLTANDVHPNAIKQLVSVDLKSDELCMIETARHYNWETHFYSVEALKTVDQQFPASETVLKVLGLRAVSGPAAMLAAGLTQKEALESDTYKSGGCTFTLGRINK